MRRYTVALFFLCCAVALARNGTGGNEGQRTNLPLHFAANTGQWDKSVRYALLGGEGTIWFCDDEIVIVKPFVSKNIPEGEQTVLTSSPGAEVVHLRFRGTPRKRRVFSLDTLPGVAHFYIGNDSSRWRTNVSTHRALRYSDIADGMDMEIELPGMNKAGENATQDAGMQVRFTKDGKPVDVQVQLTIQQSGAQRISYLDCNELHSLLALAGFSQDTYYRQLRTDGDFGFIAATTQSQHFPTRNAFQTTPNNNNAVYVKYNIKEHTVVYSTYMGDGDVPGAGFCNPSYIANYVTSISEGKLYGAFPVRTDFPVTATLPGTMPFTETPNTGNLVFALGKNGTLEAATFIGGPGTLLTKDIRVHAHRIYLFSLVDHDTVRQISADAIEPHASTFHTPYGLLCGHLAVLSESMDSLIYATYLDPSTVAGVWDAALSLLSKMDVASDGSVFIVKQAPVTERSKGVLVNETMTRDDVSASGAYILVLAPDLHSYRFATWFGFPDRSFQSQEFLLHSDGDLYLAGWSATNPGEQTPPPPGFMQRYPVDGDCQTGIVIVRFSPSGQLRGAVEICGNGYYLRTSGLLQSLCGNILWAGKGYEITSQTDGRFSLIAPFDSTSNIAPPYRNQWDNFLIEIDPSTLIPYFSSYWNHRYSSSKPDFPQTRKRPNGWVYHVTEPPLPETPDWYILGLHEQGFNAVDVRIPTPCWTILCDLRMIDTIHVERRRGYYNPVEFDVSYTVSNASAAKGARILRSWITIPNGLELIAGADTQAMSPALIGPGESATAFWRVRVTDPALLGDTARVRCRVMYVDPESGYDYPAPEELCEKEILVVPYDEPDPLLECVIDGPDSLYWQSPGLATSSTGAPGPARYIVTITNRDIDPVPIASFHLRMGEHCSIIGDTVRPGIMLAPGSSHIIIVEVDVDALRFSREIVLEAEAWDLYDLVIHSCWKETFVPGALDLYCSTRGTTRIEWYPASGITIPSSVMLNMDLENPLDTVRSSISVHVDLAAAPHLALLPGDSLVRGPFDVTSSGVKSPSWRFAFTNPPSVDVHDTIVFTYGHDGLVGQCMHIISIEIVDKSVLCSLAAADTVSEAEVLSHAPVALQYVLRNIGTLPVTVDRYELAILPGTGLTTDDPLLRPGGMIAPGMDIQLNWSMRPQILRTARVATCTVTSYVGDSVLSVCIADIFLPGIDGLRCAITATDSLRFERDSLRYNPDPVSVRLDLSNILDSEETLIEAEIDLIRASRFVLAAGENALKTLSSIDSHATAAITWLLTPQPSPTDETQDIRIRYRSTEQGVWKECTKSIVIEAWPEIAEVRCATGGHDSLHADQSYEDIVPKPFQISYTATNSGTVTLTNCTAAIILPVGFACADSDSIQSYGSLAPGETAKRWWTLTTTVQLSSFGPYEFQWQWKSDEQGTVTGCVHTVQLVPDPSGGIVFTPLHLYFEADMGGTLPTAQNIQLWTGGGLSMPWTAQSDTWYIDLDPVTGDHTTTIAVRPNTTMLNKGMHESGITLAGSAQNLPKRIAVYYQITSTTGTGHVAVPAALALGSVYPHPVPLTGDARIFVSIPEGESFRLALYDLLGRQRALLHDGVAAGAEVLLPKPVSLGFEPGMYLLRLTSIHGIATRMIAVMK